MPSETTLSNSPTSSTTTRLGAALISVFPMAWVTVRGNSPAFASVPYSAVFLAASAKSLPPVATAAFFPPPASDFAASPSAPPPLPQADRERAAATARGDGGGAAGSEGHHLLQVDRVRARGAR